MGKEVLFLLVIFSMALVTASTYDDCNVYGNCATNKISQSTNTTINGTTFHNLLANLAWSVAGHIIDADINANGYTVISSYLQGVVGLLDMRGNPWYLGGTDLELENNLIVGDNITVGNNIYPDVTLSNDIGSGALRWNWLYVRNISSEDINTYSVYASDNITTEDYFVGDGSFLTGISTYNSSYVPYTGATGNVDLNSKNLSNAEYVNNVSFSNITKSGNTITWEIII